MRSAEDRPRMAETHAGSGLEFAEVGGKQRRALLLCLPSFPLSLLAKQTDSPKPHRDTTVFVHG